MIGVGNKIKNCKKILINQAEKGYGVSDHYVNSMIIYVYVSNRYELSNNSWLYSHKKFYVISPRRFKFFGARHILRKS